MQNFSIEEIENRVSFHVQQADRFMKLFNSELHGCGFVVTTEKKTIVAAIDVNKIKAVDHLKTFFYEMSVFHVNERVKWEYCKVTGEIPVVGK